MTLQILTFLAAFVIVVSRRPDALFNAQFYAEDGMVWYPDAYRFGLHSFLMPVAGYLHALIRSVALFSLLFPFSLAPLVMNLCAMAVQILPVNVFLSSRFSQIPLKVRLLGSFLYLALPNSWEVNANITNVQWHLALLACLLLLAPLANNQRWRVVDGTVLLLTSFSTAISIPLALIAAALWWKRRQSWSAVSLALLVPGTLVQTLVALLSHNRDVGPLGATVERLIGILGRQVFFSSLLGWGAESWLTPGKNLFPVEVIAAVVGTAVVVYALCFFPFELKLFNIFCFAVFTLGLVRPLAGPHDYPQWLYLWLPGRATRYFFFPMLAFLASLLWLATGSHTHKTFRYSAIMLLLLTPVGVYEDWHYPPFENFQFKKYAEQFEHAAAGAKFSIPINPGLKMEITKR